MHLVRQIYNKGPPLVRPQVRRRERRRERRRGRRRERRRERRQWPGIPRGLGNEDEVAEKEVLETTAAEWQRTAGTIGHGPCFWLSTALSPPEPVG